MTQLDNLFERIGRSKFRSSFSLKEKDLDYIREKGLVTVRKHAEDFVAKRLAPAYIPNDGKQTPMRGHPVFPAQHATGCCCRGCFQKWHGIEPGTRLTEEQQAYAVDVIMEWIRRQLVIAQIDPDTVMEPAPRKLRPQTVENSKNARKIMKKNAEKDTKEGEVYEQLTLPFL